MQACPTPKFSRSGDCSPRPPEVTPSAVDAVIVAAAFRSTEITANRAGTAFEAGAGVRCHGFLLGSAAMWPGGIEPGDSAPCA